MSLGHRPTPDRRLFASRYSDYCLWALIAVFLLPVGVLACDADSVLTLLEDRIQSYKTIRTDYSKESHSILFGESPPENGTLWMGPPNRYRVEAKDQIIVRGADTLWTYSPLTKQVTIRAGDLDSLEFGPAGFFGSLRSDFIPVDCKEIDSNGKGRQWKVRLVAKSEVAAIQRLVLWIDQKDLLPAAAEYVDYNEETSQIRFFDYRLNQSKDRQRFTFSPPGDAEVIVLPLKKVQRKSDSDR